ncbi:hypothetical protein M9H77_30873 [Catharanthus roseus]|uniref:Uncharacterized protein n=1 Tax=Catharanthus roseus TaxID=4058 RepID=A0ACC0A2E3_CATRO|nr:hypothetical protein M9H77_30873 [Catharanthus roseus]
MRVPSYYEVHRMFYFNLYSMNNDEEMRYLWTIPLHLAKEGIHILIEFEHIQQQNIPNTHNRNITTLPEHITAVTHIVFDEPSMLYSTVNNDDDEVDGSDGDDAVSSQSESDDDNDPEEGEFQTPVNPVNSVTENIVQRWESNQWFSSARYYHRSDDNYCSWYIRIKKKATHNRWEVTRFVKERTCLVQIEQNKHKNLSSKFISMLISQLVANEPEIPVSNIHSRNAER